MKIKESPSASLENEFRLQCVKSQPCLLGPVQNPAGERVWAGPRAATSDMSASAVQEVLLLIPEFVVFSAGFICFRLSSSKLI